MSKPGTVKTSQKETFHKTKPFKHDNVHKLRNKQLAINKLALATRTVLHLI